MKHLFTLIAAVLFAGNISAQTTVGAEDNTTGWWTAFSPYYTIAPNKTLTLKFVNYSSKANNWNNWLAVVTNDADRDAEGYSEYCVLRADNYGWQYGLNTGPESSHDWYTSLTSNYNWTTFKDDMDGSTVVMTIERKKAVVTIHADITPAAGGSYFEEFVINCGDGTQTIRAFLTTDGGHLVIDDEATATTDTELPETITIQGTQIGETDLTTGWWAAFSDYYTLKKNEVLTMEFINYTSKANNWNNWILGVTTDANRNDTENGYKEYFIQRADNYCWGVYGNSNDNADIYQFSNNYNWDTFKDDMHGAKVVLTITRDGAKITAKADITTKANTEYFEQLVVDNCDDGEQNIRAFLSVDGGCLDLIKAEISENANPTPTSIQSIETAASKNAVRYNLAGQQVAAGFKGVVIENGRKLIVK